MDRIRTGSILFKKLREVLLISLLGTRLDIPTSYKTITEFQESWWIGLVGLVISIPFVFQFWRRYISDIDWQVSYLSEFSNSEGNANGSTYE